MRKLIIALCAVVALAGCQTIDNIDSFIKKQLPIACSSLDVAHAAFGVVHSARPFNAQIVESERIAYTDAKALCDHPETVTSVTILNTVIATALKINGYLRQAEAAGVE